jgi:4-amino-4-deoxy-L-arabinose transferase-like glycosyltransferase
LAALDVHSSSDRRFTIAVAVIILVLVVLRLICAAATPLSFDEALYWVWSRHIEGGYYDHPPVNPILIRLGTDLFGNTEFGVRVFGVVAGAVASFAVWRAAAILFKSERTGATAALYFNLTLVMAVGSALATPDNAVVCAATFLLLALAKLWETGRSTWWLAIGAAFGVGMLSKYTTVFFSISILAWLVLVPELRRWLLTPWPYLSGVIALLVFSPTLIWNAEHNWASVIYQFHRLVVYEWSLGYLGEFYLAQLGMATPPVFILGVMGLVLTIRGKGGPLAARVLINAMVWPLVLYFTWHTFHGRVEGNWPEPVFVAFVIAAAAAANSTDWHGIWAGLARWSRLLALPVGLAIAAAIYLQAVFAIIPLGIADPTARALGAGFRPLGQRLDAERQNMGAPVVLTMNYGLTAWLRFYLPSHPPVEQINTRIRYVHLPEPDPSLFTGPIMYVCMGECAEIDRLRRRFAVIEPVGQFWRSRRGVPIENYTVLRLEQPIGPVLDPPWPPT